MSKASVGGVLRLFRGGLSCTATNGNVTNGQLGLQTVPKDTKSAIVQW